jgi:hypothetical protein
MVNYYLAKDVKELYAKKEGMGLLKTDSSNILGIGYNKEVLHVLFNTYTIYTYEKVPFPIVKELFKIIHFKTGSLGKAFNAKIKKGGFEYKKEGVASHLRPDRATRARE